MVVVAQMMAHVVWANGNFFLFSFSFVSIVLIFSLGSKLRHSTGQQMTMTMEVWCGPNDNICCLGQYYTLGSTGIPSMNDRTMWTMTTVRRCGPMVFLCLFFRSYYINSFLGSTAMAAAQQTTGRQMVGWCSPNNMYHHLGQWYTKIGMLSSI